MDKGLQFRLFCMECPFNFNFFHSEDVVRHPVVARIVNAYEAWEEAEQKRKAALAAERKREDQEQK